MRFKICFAAAVADDPATPRYRAGATPSPFHRLDRASFAWRTRTGSNSAPMEIPSTRGFSPSQSGRGHPHPMLCPAPAHAL